MLPRGTHARWALLVPIALVTAALEAGAAVAILGLIQIVSSPDHTTTVPVAAAIARRLPTGNPTSFVLAFTAVVIAYHVLKNALLLVAHYARHRISARTEVDLATTMMRGYLSAPYALLATRNSDDLRFNATVLPAAVRDVMGSVSMLLSDSLMAAGLAVVLIGTSPGVSLLAGGGVALMILVTLRVTKNMAFRLGRLSHELVAALARITQQAFGTVKELKVLGREPYFMTAWTAQQRAAFKLGVLNVTLHSVPPLVVETCFVVGALLVVAGITVSNAGAAGLPMLGVFAYAAFRTVPVINRTTWRVNSIRGQAASVAQLYRDFCEVKAFAEAGSVERTTVANWRDISLQHVSFRYEGATADVLRDVTMRIGRGERVAIVGRTGAGKTTLVDVLLGLLQPTAGRAEIDGVECARAGTIRAAYVPQSVFVADDTLERNVAFGVPEAEVDGARVAAAIHRAALDDVVRGLPNGLATVLGERGARLSGGERQRVGIARALYHEPELLVLDEATSALDSVTEATVVDAISRTPGLSVVVIAHRLSTIRSCDRIVVVEKGRVDGSGSFEELLRTSAEFRRLVEAAESGVAPSY